MTELNNSPETYCHSRSLAIRALRTGQLPNALSHFQQALSLIDSGEPEELHHQARGNVLILEAELHPTDRFVASVRQELLESRRKEWSRRLAGILTNAYQSRREWRKALFYSQIAMTHAEDGGHLRGVSLASQVVPLTALGDLDRAIEIGTSALELLSCDHADLRAAALDNLGYALSLTARPEEGLALIGEGLALAHEKGLGLAELRLRASLSFAYLEMENPARAQTEAERVLRAARLLCLPSLVRNSLFLLGESHKQQGADAEARRVFQELIDRFVPELPRLPDYFMELDLRHGVCLL